MEQAAPLLKEGKVQPQQCDIGSFKHVWLRVFTPLNCLF